MLVQLAPDLREQTSEELQIFGSQGVPILGK
jgi:hypothetical protein